MSKANVSRAIDWDAIDEEVIIYLRDILRLDTRNPPGNELRATTYLRAVLEKEGFECVVVGPSPERATLITRLQGDGSEPPLLLMSHTDVVAVEPEKWSYDPFSGEIAHGYVYGRGALDMKNMVTMELMTMLLLKRSGIPLKRDVIYMAEADEETGGEQGAKWVVDHHPELIQAEYALNEGGGDGFKINDQLYYTVETAEKGTARFRMRTTGNPGHGSIPHQHNAVVRLAALLSKAEHQQAPIHFTDTLRGYIEGLASAQAPEIAAAFRQILVTEQGASAAIDQLLVDEDLKNEIHAMSRNTIAPTMLKAGSQINVIPSEAEAYIDGRTLPGQTLAQFRAELYTIFGSDCEIEFINPADPLEAAPDSPLFDIIKEIMKTHEPQATIVPTMLTGGTDAKHVSRLGTKVYGFAPTRYIDDSGPGGVHGHDERINVRAMQWGTRVLYEVVEKFARRDEAR